MRATVTSLDGQVHDVELTLDRVTDDGITVFVGRVPSGVQVHKAWIDVLPPKTSVEFVDASGA